MSDENTGIPYEQFTKDIFDELNRVDGVEHIEIKHNVRLEGKSVPHQIDVYWSFKQGGVTHHVVVQAKDWATPVTKDKVLTFRAVLNDLKVGAIGIMVTKTGYQAGAEAAARNNGILLYRLAEMTEKDWEGRIKTIVFRLHAGRPEMLSFGPELDRAWLGKELDRLEIPKDEGVPLQITNETRIVTTDGALLCTVADAFKTGEDETRRKAADLDYAHTFPEEAFIETGDAQLPRLKVTELRFRFKYREVVREMRTEGSDLARFILANVTDGTSHLFGPDKRHFGTREASENPDTDG